MRLTEECSSWPVTANGVRATQTILAAALHTPEKHASLLERVPAETGVCGLQSSPRVRSAADCTWTAGGGIREITAGNTFGGKPGSRGGKAIPLSHAQGVGQNCSLSFPTHLCWRLTNGERPQRGWISECLICRANKRIPAEGVF